MKKKWIYIIGALLALALIAQIFGKKESKLETTTTEAPKNQTKAIQGAFPVDIYKNLENKGFKIDKQLKGKDNFWYCDKTENGIIYHVVVYSLSADTIENVEATAQIDGGSTKSIEAAKPFLKYVSSLKYEGSDVNKLQDWIDQNYNRDGATTVIGNVRYSIFGKTKFIRTIKYEKAS